MPLLALAALIVHVGVGGYLWISPLDIAKELFSGKFGDGGLTNSLVWSIRLPRAVACLCVGGILGSVGAAFQAMFRNPLAEPFVVGVSSGAAVGGALAFVLGFATALGGLAGIFAAFITGLGSLGLTLALSRRRGMTNVQTLLIAGVVVGSMLGSLVTLILLAAGEDTNRVLRWLLGSMTPMFWNRVAILAAALAVGALILYAESRRLNVFALGEDSARRLGVEPHRLKRRVLIAGTAMAAATVGIVGIIGFLGLIAPHVARRLVGVDLRRSLVASLWTGAALLLVADVLAQRVVPSMEMPVGAVTAILGAPALLSLLHRDGHAR